MSRNDERKWRELQEKATAPRPAPPEGEYEAESQSHSPYFAGPMQLKIESCGIRFRWLGETEWSEPVEWHELMWAAGCKNEMLRDELTYMREEGYNEGLQTALDEGRERARAEGFAAGRVAERGKRFNLIRGGD